MREVIPRHHQQGLDDRSEQGLMDGSTVIQSELRAISRDTKVQFIPTKGSWRLSTMGTREFLFTCGDGQVTHIRYELPLIRF